MVRLIDADKLYEKMTKLAQEMCHDCADIGCYDCIMKNVIENVLEGWSWGEVENAPTVETGAWTDVDGFMFECSFCKEQHCNTSKYCPNCGVKMSEGEYEE